MDLDIVVQYISDWLEYIYQKAGTAACGQKLMGIAYLRIVWELYAIPCLSWSKYILQRLIFEKSTFFTMLQTFTLTRRSMMSEVYSSYEIANAIENILSKDGY